MLRITRVFSLVKERGAPKERLAVAAAPGDPRREVRHFLRIVPRTLSFESFLVQKNQS